jgi:hypothetical protein
MGVLKRRCFNAENGVEYGIESYCTLNSDCPVVSE